MLRGAVRLVLVVITPSRACFQARVQYFSDLFDGSAGSLTLAAVYRSLHSSANRVNVPPAGEAQAFAGAFVRCNKSCSLRQVCTLAVVTR
jgi:hypothetical protein